ncbi:MAG: hypothetical protein ACD_46C00060G0002 [uncultured bacterium]|nr:MAG: hypothetical protein ACD_46C00060G0002 [uncultured bacterium]
MIILFLNKYLIVKQKIFDYLFYFFRGIGRLYIKYFFDCCPASYPYITGDGFRKLADHIYDNKNKYIAVEEVKENNIVFVGIESVEDFFNQIHPQIKNRYTLITHNGDIGISQMLANKIDDKIIKWYAQNVEIKHQKLIPMPIGLENKHYYNNGIPCLYNKIRKKTVSKNSRILFGFSVSTNIEERQQAYDYLTTNSLTDKINLKINPWTYLNILNKYNFVASPPGNGIDCHRTWEAIYLGVVPIVKRSIMTEYFYKLGLPLWIIDDWNELNNLNENDLLIKYREFESRFDSPAIFMEYWKKKISFARY